MRKDMTSKNDSSKQSLTKTATQAIENARSLLVDLALDIHAHPELNYEERHAAQVLSDTLEKYGFQVESCLLYTSPSPRDS